MFESEYTGRWQRRMILRALGACGVAIASGGLASCGESSANLPGPDYGRFETLMYDDRLYDLLDALDASRDLDLEHRNGDGLRLIDLAAERDQGVIVGALVAAGASVWGADARGNNVVHIAVRGRAPRAVRELLRFMPDLKQRNRDGLTPVALAEQIGFEEGASLLRLR